MGDAKAHRRIADRFRVLAFRSASHLGSHWAFLAAVAVVVMWLVSGPLFRFSDAWQLTINTGTTVVTFLMVFLIQATQNRDAEAIQLKLDELIRASKARKIFADLEDASEDELLAFKEEFRRLRERGLLSRQGRARHRPRELEVRQPPGEPPAPRGRPPER
jgi:low affinity Fe/Cu permease